MKINKKDKGLVDGTDAVTGFPMTNTYMVIKIKGGWGVQNRYSGGIEWRTFTKKDAFRTMFDLEELVDRYRTLDQAR